MSSSSSPLPLSTDESLHLRHYHYDFQPLHSPTASSLSVIATHPVHGAMDIVDEPASPLMIPIDFPAIVSKVKTFYSASRQLSLEDVQLLPVDVTVQKTSKRAKSASAARGRRRGLSANPTKRGKGRSASAKKKKSKYYQERLLSPEEIELRETLRIIDLDNVGFFPPSELRRVLEEIAIPSGDIQKIERCLPIDDDGHYSVDNLIKLFLGTSWRRTRRLTALGSFLLFLRKNKKRTSGLEWKQNRCGQHDD